MITNVKIDGFNLYYCALKDTPPRPGSTSAPPFPSPGRVPFRGLYGRGFETP